MGAGIFTLNGMTATELAEQLGVSTDAIRHRLSAVYPDRPFRKDMIFTPTEIAELKAATRSNKKTEQPERGKKIVKHQPTPAVPNEVPPGKKPSTWFVLWPSILITALSIALTVTGLFVFAQWAGAFLGGMFALFLFMAVMVARDNMKGDTSEQALKSVLRLEVGAAGLHCFTFWRLLPQFPDGQWFFYSRCVSCAVLAGFAAYLSYSAVVTVRNYNAEI